MMLADPQSSKLVSSLAWTLRGRSRDHLPGPFSCRHTPDDADFFFDD